MKLQFDTNQDFQLDAINAAVDLFKGQTAEDIKKIETKRGKGLKDKGIDE